MKVYIPTPISKKPEKEGFYFVMFGNETGTSKFFSETNGWMFLASDHTHWLRPVELEGLLGEAWDAAIKWKYYDGLKVAGLSSMQSIPSRTQYIKSKIKEI